MRTTLNIEDDLYRRVKATAALRGCSVTSLVEESLRLVLDQQSATPDLPPMPVSNRQPGLTPEFAGSGIDLADTSAVLDHLDRLDA